MNRLLEKYKDTVKPSLMKEFNYSSVMECPKLEKVVINLGVGDAIENPKALEEAVKEKKLKKSLDAKIILNASGDELEFIKSVEPELKNVFIVSGVEVVDNGSDTKIDVELADGEKCERCWEHSVTVGADPVHPTLCQRCVNVLK